MSALGNKKLAQVAIAVRDIEASIDRWTQILGCDRPKVILVEPGNQARVTYRGVPSNATAKLAFFDLGGVQLELIEPIGEDSAWAEGLTEKGERVHHLAFWTENMAESVSELGKNRIPIIQRGDMGEGQYAYFDGTEQIGTFIELLEHKRTEL
jgi:catechol 2,3-dioxygenase-like lactoylglutathione lyase family enzyme